MKKNGLIRTLTLALAFNVAAAGTVMAQRQREEPKPSRYAEFSMEEKTGKVLYERNAQHPVYPASTTKLMTAYITFHAFKDGRLHLEDTLKVSEKAAFMPATNLWMATPVMTKTVTTGKGGKKIVKYSKGALRQDVFEIQAETALRGMLCHSANDATVIFAEAISGSTDKFVEEMNAEAQRLGMVNTHFSNTNGLPDVSNKTTVEDMAKLARALVEDFPEYYKYFSIPSITFNGHTARNTNHLLGADPAIDGMKTGWIAMSGFNLVVSAKRGDVRIIALVFGANTPEGRNTDMEHLVQYSFQKAANPKARFAYGPNPPATAPERFVELPPKLETPSPAVVNITPPPATTVSPDAAPPKTTTSPPLAASPQKSKPLGARS